MKYRQSKMNEVRKVAGLVVVSVFMLQEATTLYAHEMKEPVRSPARHTEGGPAGEAGPAAAVQAAESVPGKAVSELARTLTDRKAETHPSHSRKEKAEKWLEAHPKVKERMDKNQDGTIDKQELKRAAQLRRKLHQYRKNQDRKDYDNNPPGSAGGPGTNWENPPGAEGGPGASPDRYYRRDYDNNPPGQLGGPGTNWENKPGPQDGPGAGPDRRYFQKDRDNNPPGLVGGRGTNWENRPGAAGGPGASPDRSGQFRRDRDNNPPGLAGGRGTNWENRPGPSGGQGASPNRRGGGFSRGRQGR